MFTFIILCMFIRKLKLTDCPSVLSRCTLITHMILTCPVYSSELRICYWTKFIRTLKVYIETFIYALCFNGHIYYHPPTKLREGNVFSRVCVCVFSEREGNQAPDPAPSKAPQSPHTGLCPSRTCSNLFSLDPPPSSPPDIVKP